MSSREEERARIIEAAHRCLADSDGSFVSITDILTAAGMSTRAFYRHFGSKEDLLLAMWRNDSDKVMAELRAEVAGVDSTQEMLRRWIRGILRATSEEPRRRRALILTSKEVRSARGYGAERARFAAAHEAAVVEILQRGATDGSFPWAKPRADGRTIQAVLGHVLDAQLHQANVAADHTADEIVDFVFRGLGVRPRPDEPAAAVEASRTSAPAR